MVKKMFLQVLYMVVYSRGAMPKTPGGGSGFLVGNCKLSVGAATFGGMKREGEGFMNCALELPLLVV